MVDDVVEAHILERMPQLSGRFLEGSRLACQVGAEIEDRDFLALV